jgi:hypothetical protein
VTVSRLGNCVGTVIVAGTMAMQWTTIVAITMVVTMIVLGG